MRNLFLGAAFTLVGAGCAAPLAIAPDPGRLSAEFAQAAGAPAGRRAVLHWWELLEDPVLANLIERALAENLDIQAAMERVAQSRAFVNSAAAARLPSGGLSMGAQRFRLSETQAGAPAPRAETRYDAGFDAAWEIDLFGRVASRIAAAEADVEAAAANADAARLVVAAETARVYFLLASALERRQLVRAALERQQGIARVVSARVAEGFADPLDERRAKADLHAAEAAVPGVEAQIVALTARMAVLLGENSSDFAVPTPAAAPRTLVRIALGAPQTLLDSRPDLRAAAARARALNADVGSVRADFLPRFGLTGFLGFVSGHTAALGSAGSQSWLVGSRIGVPMLDYPKIRSRLDAARSAERQALIEYRQRVLLAVEEVEASLARYRHGQERLESLRLRAGEAAAAARLARVRYEAGRSDFLELLEAERTATLAESELSAAIATQRIAVVSVFKAFGVAWLPSDAS